MVFRDAEVYLCDGNTPGVVQSLKNALLYNVFTGAASGAGGGLLVVIAVSFMRSEGFMIGFLIFALLGLAICGYGVYLLIRAADRRVKLIVLESGLCDCRRQRLYKWSDCEDLTFQSSGGSRGAVYFSSLLYGPCNVDVGSLSQSPASIYHLIRETSLRNTSKQSMDSLLGRQVNRDNPVREIVIEDTIKPNRVIQRLRFSTSKAWLYVAIAGLLGVSSFLLALPAAIKNQALTTGLVISAICIVYSVVASRRLFDRQAKLSVLENGIYDHRKQQFFSWDNCDSIGLNAHGEGTLSLSSFKGQRLQHFVIDVDNLELTLQQLFDLVTQTLRVARGPQTPHHE